MDTDQQMDRMICEETLELYGAIEAALARVYRPKPIEAGFPRAKILS